MKLPNFKLPKSRRLNRHRFKTILFGLVGLIIVISVAAVFFGRPKLTVTPSPSSAVVFVNDEPYQPKMALKPGQTFQIFVGAPGFISKTGRLTARWFQSITRKITLQPIPKPTPIASEVRSIFVNQKTDELIALGEAGRTFQTIQLLPNNNYQVTAISKNIVPALQEPPILSPDWQLAIFRQTDGSVGLFDFKLYDLTNQEFHDWGSAIGDVAWRSDGQRLIYVIAPPGGERTLIKTDRDRHNLERLFDLKPEGIVNPALQWSQDQSVVALVANGNLYFLDPQTKILTKVVVDGVSSANLSPTNRQVAYTQNGELMLLSYRPVDPFSKSELDQKNIGRVIIATPIRTRLTAEASQTAYSQDGNRLLAIAKNHVYEIFTKTGFSYQVTASEGGNVEAIAMSNDDHHLYVIIGGTLYDWYLQ